MDTWQIIPTIIIIGLTVIIPIHFWYKNKKLERKLKNGREVSEKEKIRVYINDINEKFRAKHK